MIWDKIVSKLQWENVDEVIMFTIAATFVLGVVALGVKYQDKFPSEAWPVITLLIGAVVRTLKRERDHNGNGNNGYVPPVETTTVPPTT